MSLLAACAVLASLALQLTLVSRMTFGDGPADIGSPRLYDGFSVITFQRLEALGFCEPA